MPGVECQFSGEGGMLKETGNQPEQMTLESADVLMEGGQGTSA